MRRRRTSGGSDITYLSVGGEWVYLAMVIDMHSQRVAGWFLAVHLRSGLVTDALAASFLAIVERELLQGMVWLPRKQLRLVVFAWLRITRARVPVQYLGGLGARVGGLAWCPNRTSGRETAALHDSRCGTWSTSIFKIRRPAGLPCLTGQVPTRREVLVRWGTCAPGSNLCS